MKKTWISIVVLICLGTLGGLLFTALSPKQPQVVQQVNRTSPGSVQPTPISAPVISEPQTLIIPKLNIQANVEAVGEDNAGKMDVPKQVNDVGWYNLGYKPGEKGSAVIDGHLDTVTGAPAVFYYIGNLSPGDEVIITDKNGKDLTFVVTKSVSYQFDQVPLQEVFNTQDKPRLNLITCVGVWNTGTRNYSNRLVVYTELKQ